MQKSYNHFLSITSENATSIINDVLHSGEKKHLNFSVAVTDVGGHLLAFGRSDDAPFLTVDMAINKAWSACSFGQPTLVWNHIVQDSHMAPITETNRLVAVGGGYPIILNKKVIGGLGISGGSYQEDHETAEQILTSQGFSIV